jgi:hypothetical protein
VARGVGLDWTESVGGTKGAEGRSWPVKRLRNPLQDTRSRKSRDARDRERRWKRFSFNASLDDLPLPAAALR